MIYDLDMHTGRLQTTSQDIKHTQVRSFSDPLSYDFPNSTPYLKYPAWLFGDWATFIYLLRIQYLFKLYRPSRRAYN